MRQRITIILMGLGMGLSAQAYTKFSDNASEQKTTFAPSSSQWQKISGTVTDLERRSSHFTIQPYKGETMEFTYSEAVRIYRVGQRITFMDLHRGDSVEVKYAVDRSK